MNKEEFNANPYVRLATKLGVEIHQANKEETIIARLEDYIAEHPEHKKALDAIKEAPKGPTKITIEEYRRKVAAMGKQEADPRAQHLSKQQKINNATKQLRVIVTCHNPNKHKWQGETITAANDFAKEEKYILFNEPYHVPKIILKYLEEKEFQEHYETISPVTGKKVKATRNKKEFTVTHLAALTEKEIEELAVNQVKRKAIEE